MSAVARLRPILTPPKVKHTASLIFLHGSGDSGIGIKDWLTSATNGKFSFPHIRILYPTAPVRPYSAMDGFPTNVWFDRKEISPFIDEDLDGLDDMCHAVRDLVDVEVKNGIPRHRIMIGGFSMGGALALHCGFRFCQDVAGIFALSSFLNENSVVYKTIKEARGQSFPPLFQAHGNDDLLITVDWGRSTNQNLASLGIKTQFTVYPNVPHSLDTDEIGDLTKWIHEFLPEKL